MNAAVIPARTVAPHFGADPGEGSDHERASLSAFVDRIAALRDRGDRHLFQWPDGEAGHTYLVPDRTLTREQAAELGIRGPQDLFGGVVPHPFVATKSIVHPLVSDSARAAHGWNAQVAQGVGDAVLRGFTAFDLEDAEQAGLRLLGHGPLRVKPVRARGGHGQCLVRDAQALREALAQQDAAEVATWGLVLEEHLSDVRTLSVGQVQIGDLSASYHGRQRLTLNHRGNEVYGGSDLSVVRGDFDALLAQPLEPEVRTAIEQARRFDAAVRDGYEGFYATRCNYDIAQGLDAQGRWRSGVLEQSWRVGGATGCELAALETLQREPERRVVHAHGFECFGDTAAPAGAIVHYQSVDPVAGALLKYTLVDP